MFCNIRKHFYRGVYQTFLNRLCSSTDTVISVLRKLITELIKSIANAFWFLCCCSPITYDVTSWMRMSLKSRLLLIKGISEMRMRMQQQYCQENMICLKHFREKWRNSCVYVYAYAYLYVSNMVHFLLQRSLQKLRSCAPNLMMNPELPFLQNQNVPPALLQPPVNR